MLFPDDELLRSRNIVLSLKKTIMGASTWIRQHALSLELRFIHRTAFLGKIPLLRIFHRNVTADVWVLGPEENVALGFVVQFKTPYLHLPVELKKSQIGHEGAGQEFTPSAFRFFDWQSWAHIQGRIEWQDERRVDIDGEEVTVITGFSYRTDDIHTPLENFGLRLAEGVEGHANVLWNRAIVELKFEPLYWMFEPKNGAYAVVAIKDTELAMLIVSLSEIGSGNPRVYGNAVDRLEEWTAFKLQKKSPEKALLEFLRHIRDWGPLGMEPLFGGLKEVLERLGFVDKERVLFEFYADNWGFWDKRHGRLLVIKILEALGTKKALFTLEAISDYVKNQAIPSEELELIRGTIDRVGENLPPTVP